MYNMDHAFKCCKCGERYLSHRGNYSYESSMFERQLHTIVSGSYEGHIFEDKCTVIKSQSNKGTYGYGSQHMLILSYNITLGVLLDQWDKLLC